MKYLLLPFTLSAWALISYFSLFAVYVGIMMIVQLSWLWIILGFTFLIGIVYLVGVGIPNLLKILIVKLYSNRTTNILHALAGFLGIVIFLIFLFSPAAKSTFNTIWIDSKWKLIINIFPFLGLILANIISNLQFFNVEGNEDLIDTSLEYSVSYENDEKNKYDENLTHLSTVQKYYNDEDPNEDDIILPDDVFDLINSLTDEEENSTSKKNENI